MAPKRATAASTSSSSTSKRAKVEPQDDDAKPDIRSKLEDYTPSVTSVSRDWLKYTDPDKLEKLLLEGCRLSPAFDALLDKAVKEDASLLDGDGGIQDFREEVSEIKGLLQNWYEGETWPEIVGGVNGLAGNLTAKSPLLSKLNALKALADLIYEVDMETSGQHSQFAEGEDPEDMWTNLRDVLKMMTDADRRKYIDAKLVKALDNIIETKGTRSLYGKKGRDVGDQETEDEDEDGEDDD